MGELLLPVDGADMVVQTATRWDIRDHKDETYTVQCVDHEFYEHARWSIRHNATIEDHRGKFWMTMIQEPATEMQGECDTFLFTRMVDGVEYVVFDEAESYEVTTTKYRRVVDENGF